MKIQCGVCHKGEATVFCPADEAALCDGCDNSIHHANKLAGKHTRFSLIHPSLKEFPICDICQERRAFLFCKEDRAILCRECDVPIHKANEHTQKHDRFLLTGVKLHASSSLYPTSTSSNGSEANIDTEIRSPQSSSRKRPDTFPNELFLSSPSGNANPTASKVEENQINDSTDSISTSSISEYLMETLPGWRVEDLLDPAFPANGFCKSFDQSLPLVDQDLERNMGSFPSEDSGTWIPQVLPQFHLFPQTDFLNGFKESAKTTDVKMSSQKWSDDGFTVPQINPPSKKSRRFR
ncbi:B-box zinc finger protein 20-like isoform X1 [Juglans microcarpa x Juglans regia]|uniref:B-box zinc finger protein 20-like isoform X1 n=2 Tax=Juglans microcarpa x Juglans regia TaxID=2249226 RepID=UPI001B7F58E9|nr:B-box zinc finger protein 20-like isoform X1 [Juglans microcarpa x Juglans regia]